MNTSDYLHTVQEHLEGLPAADRRRALDALAAQLDELADIHADPLTTLGDPRDYADHLAEALSEDTAEQGSGRLFGVPYDTRGPMNEEARSRTWDPTNPHLFVPRLFGLGWTMNLGALAVRLGLIRPDDASEDVLEHIPSSALRLSSTVPLAIAGGAAISVAASWRRLPPTVASGFGYMGKPRGQAPRWTLIVSSALGVIPALWAQRTHTATEDRLVRSASATSLAVIAASAITATLAQARSPHQRWGLLVPAALPVALAASLAVIVVPLKSGLRRAWENASAPGTDATTTDAS